MELIHQLILVKINVEYVKFFGYAFLVLFILTLIFFELEERYANLHDLMTKIEKQQEEIQNQRSLISTLISERDGSKLTRRRTHRWVNPFFMSI